MAGLRDGVRCDFQSRPRPWNMGVSLRNLNEEQNSWLKAERERCFSTGAFEPATSSQHVSKAFLVPKPSAADGRKRWRLIVDLRPLNAYCTDARGMRFETLSRLRTLSRPGDYYFSLDLQDGYNMIGIHPSHRKYFTFDMGGELVQCAAIPFGWNWAPRVFCSTMRVLTRTLRTPSDGPWKGRRPDGSTRGCTKKLNPWRDGVRMLAYLDDYLFLCETREEAYLAREFVHDCLEFLGLTRNTSKGQWEPQLTVEYLGMEVDSKDGVFRVPATKVKKIKQLAVSLLCRAKREKRWLPARAIASFAGLVQSVYLAVPPARYHLRSLHDVLKTKKNWTALVKMDNLSLSDLQWWTALPPKWQQRGIWRRPDTARLHCDASDTGWGGVLNERLPAHGFWRLHQKGEHITLKELRAVRYTVETFLPHLRGRRVLLWEDNQAVVAILTHLTSKSPSLMAELRRLWWLMDVNDIQLRAKYIRSAANIWADSLSRRGRNEDWKLHPRIFKRLDAQFGPHTVDAFGTANNRQLSRYFSEMPDPQSSGVDAFAQDLSRENVWANPPWSRLREFAHLLVNSEISATVACPCWPSEDWHQQLRSISVYEERLQPEKDMFLDGLQGSALHVGAPQWPVSIFRVCRSKRYL